MSWRRRLSKRPKAPARPPFDVEGWARSAQPPKCGVKLLLDSYPKCAADVVKAAELWAAGEVRLNFAMIHQRIVIEEYGLDCHVSVVASYLKRRRPDLYEQVKTRGI